MVSSGEAQVGLKDADEVLAAYEENRGRPLVLRVDPEWGYLYRVTADKDDDGGEDGEEPISLLSDSAYLVLSPAQPRIVFFWIGAKASLKTIAAVSIKALEVRGGGASGGEQGSGSGASSPSTTRREDQGNESAEFHHALYGYYRWSSRSPTHRPQPISTTKRRRRPAGDNLIHHDMPCLYTILARRSTGSATAASMDIASPTSIKRVSSSLVVLARPLIANEVIGRSDRVMLLTDFGNRRVFLWCGKDSSMQLRGCGLEAASYLSQVR